MQSVPEDIAEYADRLYRLLDTKDRAADSLMEERLLICEKCEKHEGGTCLSCGCYTIVRVMKKDSRCPQKKW
ncbi:MAG: DUF6171 family protein [Lachnospiraceae bacterium]|nr:DUF6171 family protein [Lachnospiraceae bacterium]